MRRSSRPFSVQPVMRTKRDSTYRADTASCLQGAERKLRRAVTVTASLTRSSPV